MRHVLAVDNEPGICDMIQMALEGSGAYRVTVATGAQDALAALEFGPRPDAAIVDAVLPHLSGFEIARRALGRSIPVLIVTGHPVAVSRLEAVACPFLRKPFHLDLLLTDLGALFEHADRRRAELAAHLTKLIAAMVALVDFADLMNVLPSAMMLA